MKWIKTYERWIYIGALVVGAIIWVTQREETTIQPLPLEQNEQQVEQAEKQEEQTSVFVDVKGAVKRAGVYEVASTSRIRDVIEIAGGLTEEADETKVNLAMKVRDEMVIYVPKKGEEISELADTHTTTDGSNGKVNINTATAEQLQTLQGIGPAKAAAIIAYREEHGPFQKAEDLLNVSGIGQKSLEKIKEQIVVR
ncbi:helix-hairpin-helix domain-containing protein [Anoxybacillus ayderensis]|uniref:helix-hairpin-helix domain-containing protein n=1 Tax=Anoxybacillus ayderensis TaxID=265546 RepID=UPI000A26CBBA|nr:helix-hairpin-helix domain-containing protein [Anoxybacillus ayderensis]MBA2878901.1 competence protein ComEA [Anoxybacillus ayderensis]MED0686624.1 helix-hairpin-helix domain-containing protein [Anoxybacillus ayderensis]OSX55054.1 competence protein ComEA [Anoxybacillus ayderensis]